MLKPSRYRHNRSKYWECSNEGCRRTLGVVRGNEFGGTRLDIEPATIDIRIDPDVVGGRILTCMAGHETKWVGPIVWREKAATVTMEGPSKP